jgi:hypothetical protein
MAEVPDGYDSYYAERLWKLIPAVYRARDSDDASVTGPLQELLTRVGAQVAVVRRSIDRLWADQFIETSDDWVIPYIGDLLDTNLINGLDARGRRLDVAKTIHYRRRKGTVAVLEEIARDVTGWDAHIVEAFRRLSRTRHNLDPPVGPGPLAAALPTPCLRTPTPPGAPQPHDLLEHEGLIGSLTGTPSGGFADVRSLHGGDCTNGPFDEYFHTADLRKGAGAVGRYGIPKLLVFLWRLESFAVEGGTPVPVTGCTGEYVFDPTGRFVPLFLQPLQPEPDDAVDSWTSTPEWDVPGRYTSSLQFAIGDPGTADPRHAAYPDADHIPAFASAASGTPAEPVTIEVYPEVGQFKALSAVEPGLTASYQYGFPAAIGAGPYDRTLLGNPPAPVGTERVVSGGAGFDTELAAAAGAATVTIADSLTYEAVADVGSTAAPIGSLLVRAGDSVRPVVRLPAAATGDPPVAWTFTGGGEDADLMLDGLLISGGDVVLRGAFKTVRLTGCTTDPGTLDTQGDAYTLSADKRLHAPTRIWIEADPDAEAGTPGAIVELVVDHCVLGPVRTRNGGAVEALTITDSVVQGIAPDTGVSTLDVADVYDPELLARALGSDDPLSQSVFSSLSAGAQTAITNYVASGGILSVTALKTIVSSLNALIGGGTSIYSDGAFLGVPLDPQARQLLAEGAAADTAELNLALLEDAFPEALSPAAIALAAGTVVLQRVTVLGRTFVHRLQASDSILDGFAAVEDTQDGCVRFSSTTAESSVPRRYLSVSTAVEAPLFTSRAFGAPGYAQLLESADGAIVGGASDVTITSGAETGSEMGAYSSQLAPIKERGLLVKFDEYMPLGLTPVVVHVT